MHTWGKALVATALLLCAQAPPAGGDPAGEAVSRAVPPAVSRAIPDQYVVTLADPAATEHAITALGVQPLFVYRSALHGFAARLSAEQVGAVRTLPGFVSLHQDRPVRVAHQTDTVRVAHQSGPVRVAHQSGSTARVAAAGSWGLDRIDRREQLPAGPYAVQHDGAEVTAYILDTGIDVSHPQFGGRASVGHDSVGDGRHGADCAGHGTHVAGTVGSAGYGVARRVRLVAVRVLDCAGAGPLSQLIDGIDWVSAHAVRPAVANISVTSPRFDPLDAAVAHLARTVFTVVAAGNQADAACDYSPARAEGAFTVGASTPEDGFADYSNHGRCVRLLAPGSDIVSTLPGGRVGALTGTSMAAPHVTGVVALYEQATGASGQHAIRDWLGDNATRQRIQHPPPPADTPNLLLYTAGL
ncbi:S8 family peptidase [Goodfellowiella coeruleoviolacea]|uniref:Serine protease, subtilisin family n=1 Tax=Goodfellowiella coeruleoviolacea TaxID=334858 RepID=A0AAE3KNT0_9PSEU|nr:S8 family peptidase [Goodfellowiella coeruleoviolacea]MCP2169013.1 Serine protease, subtilisin family [Goodfellowiella coeruleoviolacea]